jgi:hypothetical protein
MLYAPLQRAYELLILRRQSALTPLSRTSSSRNYAWPIRYKLLITGLLRAALVCLCGGFCFT